MLNRDQIAERVEEHLNVARSQLQAGYASAPGLFWRDISETDERTARMHVRLAEAYIKYLAERQE